MALVRPESTLSTGRHRHNMIEEYKYSSITSDFIRLLHLGGSDALIGKEKVLQGTLEVVPVKSPGFRCWSCWFSSFWRPSFWRSTSFDAISYVCGPDYALSECILIDEKKLKITKNCHTALRHLRDQFGVRTLWVDAICISQQDDVEKSGQIPLMTGIYGRARKVYVWLGKDETLNCTLDWLKAASLDKFPLLGVRFGNFPENIYPREVMRLMLMLPEILRAQIRRLGIGSALPEYNHMAMRELIDRSWFTRMWTIQEIAMAGEGLAVCGSKAIRWSHLVWGIEEAYKNADDSEKKELAPIVNSVMGVYWLWIEVSMVTKFKESIHRKWVSQESKYYGKWITFLDFMEEQGTRIACFELAAIFATIAVRYCHGLRPLRYFPLVGLIYAAVATLALTPPKTNRQWDHGLRSILVDYLNGSRKQQAGNPKDKVYALYGLLQQLEIDLPSPDYSPNSSIERTYLNFTKSIIIWHRSLEILMEASGPWSDTTPSWVPDWSRSYDRLQCSDANISTWNEPPPERPLFSFCDDFSALRVSAKRIGRVVFRADPLARGSFTPISIDRYVDQQYRNITSLREWLRIARDTYLLPVDKLGDFLASIPTWQATYDLNQFQQWTEIILDDDPMSPRNMVAGLDREQRILLTLGLDEMLWRLHKDICNKLADTLTFFVAKSDKVHLIGVGPNSIQNKDAIFLLPTLRVPVVLREMAKLESIFQLMGAIHMPRPPCIRNWSEDDARNQPVKIV